MTNKSPNKSRFFYGYVIVATCFCIMVFFWGTYHSFGVFFESLLQEFGWTRAATSAASSLNNLLFSFTGILVARLCDKYNLRLVIALCGVALGLGYFLLARLQTLWELYFYYGVLIAIGMGAYIAIPPIIARWFVKRRGAMTGLIFSGMGLGLVVVPPIASRLIAVFQWRFSFVIMGLIALVGTVIAAQFLKREPRQMGLLAYGEKVPQDGGQPSVMSGLTLKEAVRTRPFWLVGGMYFIYVACLIAVTVHIVIHATSLNVTATAAAGTLSIVGAFNIIGMNVMGSGADRYGIKQAFGLSFAIMAASFIWLLFVRDAATLYIFAALFGFAAGGTQILFSPILAELFGLKSLSVILATSALAASLGGAVGPYLAGYIFDATGSYRLDFIASAGLAALAVVLTLLIKPVQAKI